MTSGLQNFCGTRIGDHTCHHWQWQHFFVPSKGHILCWDCGYYGHRKGKVCPNYNPSKYSEHKDDGKTKKVNITTGRESSTVAYVLIFILVKPGPSCGNMRSIPAKDIVVNESVSCTINKDTCHQTISFLEKMVDALDGNVECCNASKFNNSNTDTNMTQHVRTIFSNIGNFSMLSAWCMVVVMTLKLKVTSKIT